MAWYKRWQIPFQSIEGTSYMVFIHEKNTGSLVTLTGAEDPFVTSEDNSDDVFTPVRRQTGYLRVIDEIGGGLLEQLIPTNNTEKFVQLCEGSWNDGTFTSTHIRWQGFLCAEAFTQPWDNQKNVIEFPVKSVIAALEDIQLPEEYSNNEKNIAYILARAFDYLSIGNNEIRGIWLITDIVDGMSVWYIIVQYVIFFSEETESDEGENNIQFVGCSFLDAISSCLSLFGLCLRECGDEIFLEQHDQVKSLRAYTISLLDLNTIAQGTSYIFPYDIGINPASLLQSISFKGTNNVAGYVQGGRSAKVDVSINTDDINLIQVPVASESSGSLDIVNLINGKLYIQRKDLRNGQESWNFFRYNVAIGTYQETPTSTFLYWIYTQVAGGSYTNFINNSLFRSPSTHLDNGGVLYTGATPCRWFYQSGSETVKLKSGLFLTQQTTGAWPDAIGRLDQVNYNIIYSIAKGRTIVLEGGYLNIDMSCYPVEENAEGNAWAWGTNTMLFVSLQYGSWYWDGTTWTQTSCYFNITFQGGSLITNKTGDMNVDASTGYFIPIWNRMGGDIIFRIYDVADNRTWVQNNGLAPLDERAKIISDLKISFLYNNDVTASYRTHNTYRKTILQSGFSEDKDINLSLGTMNNNVASPSFIKHDPYTYISSLGYYTDQETSQTYSDRPEKRLLDRMVAQYGKVRRTFKGVIGRLALIPYQWFTYNNRNYFAVDAEHHWSEDEQDVKFIEVD